MPSSAAALALSEMLLAPFSAGFTLRGGPYAVRAPIDPALLTARPRTARVAMDLDERPPRGLGGRRRQLTRGLVQVLESTRLCRRLCVNLSFCLSFSPRPDGGARPLALGE